jgi:hypothetical protein
MALYISELYKMQTTGLNLESLRGKIVSLGQALEREENVFPAGMCNERTNERTNPTSGARAENDQRC